MEEITVICEKCGKTILEKEANCLYINNNYAILCNHCYDEHFGRAKEGGGMKNEDIEKSIKVVILANNNTKTEFTGKIPYDFVQDLILKLVDKYEDSTISFIEE